MPDSPQPMRVLISGAGVAGPTLAYFLAQTGRFRVTVVEKATSFLAQGQNIDITGSAITAVKKMGQLDRIREHNTTEMGSRFIDPRGRPIAPFPLADSGASLTNEFEILRGDLASVLYEPTQNHPDVEYLFGTTVQQVLANDEKSVTVALSNGQQRAFDLAVAADGQWSKLRTQCFPPDALSVLDTDMYAVFFSVPRLPADDDWWNIHVALRSRILTLRPDNHGTMRAMLTFMPNSPAQREAWRNATRADRAAQKALVRREFTDAGWQAPRFLAALDAGADDFYFWNLQQIRMRSWTANRVVCLGDAAHAPTPLTGAGATLAITGAYVLAGELSKLRPGEHPARALAAHEALFKPWVEKMQHILPFVPGIAHPRGALHRWVLHCFLSAVSSVVRSKWMASRGGRGEENDDGFPLPEYPTLQAKSG